MKKHWVFKAYGLVLTIHDFETDEEVCSVIHSDGVLTEDVEQILKMKGYYTYNFNFNEKRTDLLIKFGFLTTNSYNGTVGGD